VKPWVVSALRKAGDREARERVRKGAVAPTVTSAALGRGRSGGGEGVVGYV